MTRKKKKKLKLNINNIWLKQQGRKTLRFLIFSAAP
jgi:hypothetical protein